MPGRELTDKVRQAALLARELVRTARGLREEVGVNQRRLREEVERLRALRGTAGRTLSVKLRRYP